MQDVSFKTKPTSPLLGTPTRAKACRCGRQVVDLNDDAVCVMCGHACQQVIDRQWSAQAFRNRRSVPKSLRPFREGNTGRLYRTAA